MSTPGNPPLLTIERLTTGVIDLDEYAMHRDLTAHLRSLLRHLAGESGRVAASRGPSARLKQGLSASPPPRPGGPGRRVAVCMLVFAAGLVVAAGGSRLHGNGAAGKEQEDRSMLAAQVQWLR